MLARTNPLAGAPLATISPLHASAPLQVCTVSDTDGSTRPHRSDPVTSSRTSTGGAVSPVAAHRPRHAVMSEYEAPAPGPVSPTDAPVVLGVRPWQTPVRHHVPMQPVFSTPGLGSGHYAGITAITPTATATTGSSPLQQPNFNVGAVSKLNLQTFRTFFDAEGRCSNEYDLHKAVYWQGIAKEARQDVWPCVLGVYAADSSAAQREQHTAKLRSDYQALLSEVTRCEANNGLTDTALAARIKEIEKDVPRTDRGVAFYSDGDGASLAMLRRILVCYAALNRTLGYVQGMNDVASVVLLVFKDDEAMAFWCFVKIMERMGDRFSDLAASAREDLRSLMEHVDHHLHRHIDSLSGREWKFCLRWTLLCFKRELPINGVIELWERVWSRHKAVDFTTYVIGGLLLQNRFSLLSMQSDEDLHQFAHWISSQLHVKTLLEGGQFLLEKFKPPSRHANSSEELHSPASIVAPPRQGFVPRAVSEQPPHLLSTSATQMLDHAAQWQSATTKQPAASTTIRRRTTATTPTTEWSTTESQDSPGSGQKMISTVQLAHTGVEAAGSHGALSSMGRVYTSAAEGRTSAEPTYTRSSQESRHWPTGVSVAAHSMADAQSMPVSTWSPGPLPQPVRTYATSAHPGEGSSHSQPVSATAAPFPAPPLSGVLMPDTEGSTLNGALPAQTGVAWSLQTESNVTKATTDDAHSLLGLTRAAAAIPIAHLQQLVSSSGAFRPSSNASALDADMV